MTDTNRVDTEDIMTLAVHAYLDESEVTVSNSTRGLLGFLYASGLVLVEGTNTLQSIQKDYDDAYLRILNHSAVRNDPKTSARLKTIGFHAAEDDTSLADMLREFAQEQISLSYHYRFSFVPIKISDQDKKSIYLGLHERNVKTVLRKVTNGLAPTDTDQVEVRFTFEQFAGLNASFQDLVKQSVRSNPSKFNRILTQVKIEEKKPENGLLAIADSFVTTFSRLNKQNILECKDISTCPKHCLSYNPNKTTPYESFGHIDSRSIFYRSFSPFRPGLRSSVQIEAPMFSGSY